MEFSKSTDQTKNEKAMVGPPAYMRPIVSKFKTVLGIDLHK